MLTKFSELEVARVKFKLVPQGWSPGNQLSDPLLSQVLCSLKRKEPKKTLHYSQSLVAFVNTICLVCSEKSLSLYFKSKVSFLCLWHFFFYPVKEFKPILWCFFPLFPYIILHFTLWKAAQEWLTGQLTIYSVLQGTFHFFFYDFKEVFGSRGKSTSIHNQNGFVWVKNSTLWNIFAER